MSGAHLKLTDCTAVIVGSLSSTAQLISTYLVELGANVALVHKDYETANRFCRNVLNMREVHPEFGRSAAVQLDEVTEPKIQEALTNASQLFGGMNIYIDCFSSTLNHRFNIPKTADELAKACESTKMVSRQALRFLESRGKGRMIIIGDDLALIGGRQNTELQKAHPAAWAHTLACESKAPGVTINSISIGVTEEYLLKRFPEKNSLNESLNEFKKDFPLARLTKSDEIATALAFLASPLSRAVHGHNLAVNHNL